MKYITIIFLFISFKCYAPPMESNEVMKRNMELRSFDTRSFSKEALLEYIKLHDSVYYKPIMQQAILETGWFTSGSFKKYNNLFGMKYANRRPNKVTGKAMDHASFDHWSDSVEDYFLWREYKLKQKNLHISDYYVFLKQVGYAEATNYCQTLKKIKI